MIGLDTVDHGTIITFKVLHHAYSYRIFLLKRVPVDAPLSGELKT